MLFFWDLMRLWSCIKINFWNLTFKWPKGISVFQTDALDNMAIKSSRKFQENQLMPTNNCWAPVATVSMSCLDVKYQLLLSLSFCSRCLLIEFVIKWLPKTKFMLFSWLIKFELVKMVTTTLIEVFMAKIKVLAHEPFLKSDPSSRGCQRA